jgi:hypothetical protein
MDLASVACSVGSVKRERPLAFPVSTMLLPLTVGVGEAPPTSVDRIPGTTLQMVYFKGIHSKNWIEA